MRNILVYCLIVFGFCSFSVFGEDESFELPSDFRLINSCLNSDKDIIYFLGAYVDSDDEYTSINIIRWYTNDDSDAIFSTDVLQDIQSAEFNGTMYPPNNVTYLLCPETAIYVVQGFGDPKDNLNKMFKLEVSDLSAPQFNFVTFGILLFVSVFALF